MQTPTATLKVKNWSINLYKFQEEDVLKLTPRRSRLIGNDPGTGKTYEGIALDMMNRDDYEQSHLDDYIQVTAYDLKTLVIAPKTVMSVWDDHCMDLTDLDVYVIDTKNRNKFIRDVLDPKKGGYFICNWDSLRLMPELRRITWFHVIADEVHRSKNRKAQVTQALWKLHTVRKTGMSGTPADKPQDLWAILHWLWPKYYTSFWNFTKAYLETEKAYEGNEDGYTKFTGGVKNVDVLHKEMEPWFVRRRKEDVLPDLPDKYNSRLWVDLSPKQRKAYDEMRKVMVAWVEEHEEEIARMDPIIAQATVVQLIRLQQFADGYVVPKRDEQGNHMWSWRFPKGMSKEDRATIKALEPDDPRVELYKRYLYNVTDPSAKIDAIMELLEDRPNEQIVIFSQFKSVINLLAKRLQKNNITHRLLTGDVGQDDRARAIEDFQAGNIQVFAGTIAAGGVGITLTASSTLVFIDRTWSPAVNVQAEDRLHRIGQTNAVEIIDLMARNTVDLGKAQKLFLKAKWIKVLLGDTVDLNELFKLEENENG